MSNESRSVAYPLPGASIALAVACLANFIPNYAQYQASPFGAAIMERFVIEPGQFSLLFSSPMIPAIFLSLVAGLLIDKFGPRDVVGVGMCITAVGCVIRVFAGSFGMLLLGTALTGFAACFINSGAAKVLAGYYGPEGVGPKMGVFMAASTLAMTVALATSAAFGDITPAFMVSSAIAAIGAILWFVFMRDPEAVGDASASQWPSMGECLKVVFTSRNTWMVALALAFILGGNVVMGSFTPTILAQKGIEAGMAGIITSMYTLGNLAGCFTAPALVGVMGGRQKPVLLVYAALAAVGVAFAWRPDNAILIAVCMFLAGNFTGGLIPMCFSLPVQFEEIGPVYAGTAGGMLTTIQVLGAIFLPSYVFAGIAGSDLSIMFLLGGASMLVAGAFLALAKMR